MARLKKKTSIEDLFVAGPSDLNDGKCAFTLTKKSKFAGVVFRIAGAQIDEETGRLLFQYEVLYCPRTVKLNDDLVQEIGLVLNHVHNSTEEVKDVQAE